MTDFTPPPRPSQADYEGQNRVQAWAEYSKVLACQHKADVSITESGMTCSECHRPITMISDIQRASLSND